MRPLGKLQLLVVLDFVSIPIFWYTISKGYLKGEGLLLSLFIHLIFLIYTVFCIVYPLSKFIMKLESLSQEDEANASDNGNTYRDDKGIPYINMVYKIVDRDISRRTRKSSIMMIDKSTQMAALQSQINPHFLYNTLECIRGEALIKDDYVIAGMSEALGSFFRYSISRGSGLVTLRDELNNTKNYMLIQQYRFDNRFTMEVLIDEEDEEAYDYFIPRLILQPVVENAIFHGLEENDSGGKITIEVMVTGPTLIITVSDNGSGMDSDKLTALNNKIWRSGDSVETEDEPNNQKRTGIALPNIHRRIQLLFGESYGVNVYSTYGVGTDVELTMPAGYELKEGDKTA